MKRLLLRALSFLICASLHGASAPERESPSRLWVRLRDEQNNPVTARVYVRTGASVCAARGGRH